MKQKIIYTTENFSAGVEGVSRYLESYFGFFRTSEQDIFRKSPKDYNEAFAGESPALFRAVRQLIGETKEAIDKGENVVMDFDFGLYREFHTYSGARWKLFNDILRGKNLEKFLIYVDADPEIRARRILERKGIKNDTEKWLKNLTNSLGQPDWIAPFFIRYFKSVGFEIIKYQNNTEEDLQVIKQDLDTRFASLKTETPVVNREMVFLGRKYSNPEVEQIFKKRLKNHSRYQIRKMKLREKNR
jgi:dephospho-CoA kinase